MTALLSILLLGFFLGMRHTTDPDHVIAITTIVSRERKVSAAAWIGVLWGLGHTLTILVVGGVIILFGLVIPARLGLSMEFSVAVMLIVLGLANLRGAMGWLNDDLPSIAALGSRAEGCEEPAAAAAHPAQGPGLEEHTHAAGKRAQEQFDRSFGRLRIYRTLRPVIVGIVHGLAGSAALALLVLAAIRTPWWGVAYLLIFGFGTIAGMVLITVALALPFAMTTVRFGQLHRSLQTATGFLSLGFGLFLAYQFGIFSGLFTSHPHWNPR